MLVRSTRSKGIDQGLQLRQYNNQTVVSPTSGRTAGVPNKGTLAIA